MPRGIQTHSSKRLARRYCEWNLNWSWHSKAFQSNTPFEFQSRNAGKTVGCSSQDSQLICPCLQTPNTSKVILVLLEWDRPIMQVQCLLKTYLRQATPESVYEIARDHIPWDAQVTTCCTRLKNPLIYSEKHCAWMTRGFTRALKWLLQEHSFEPTSLQ